MTILFFDTETTGFYRDYLPFADDRQPRLVQLAAALVEDDGSPISQVSLIVNPGIEIPQRASDVHGITTETARKFGVSPKTAVGHYHHMRSRADLLVAHNLPFDIGVMECANALSGMDVAFDERPVICTMEAAAPIVNLPPTAAMIKAGRNHPKSPKLSECIAHFFGEDLEDAHDALVDLQACRRVYFHITAMGAQP